MLIHLEAWRKEVGVRDGVGRGDMLSWARDWPCSGLNVVEDWAYLVVPGTCPQVVLPSFD